MPPLSVHEHAQRLLDAKVLPQVDRLRVARHEMPCGGCVLDFGCEVAGGFEAGRLLAQLSLGGLASVSLTDSQWSPTGVGVAIETDHPLVACLGSQYAGWPISEGDFFAMGSGPFRASRGREKVLEECGLTLPTNVTVGILESRRLPPDAVVQAIADACKVPTHGLTLAVAPTSSLAGMIQIVARSVETCLHKLHELHVPLASIVSARGTAPLPPATIKDRIAMGWTNDSVLYGAEVVLWVDEAEVDWASVGPQIPSSSSSDYGRPFGEIFEAYGRDFYRIDPLLFSPAAVKIVDRRSGKVLRFGQVAPEILEASFGVVH